MIDKPELLGAKIRVISISEPKNWHSPDNKDINYWEILAQFGEPPEEKMFSLWNPRIRPHLEVNQEYPIKYSKRGSGLKLEEVIGLPQGRGKSSWKENRDPHIEHIGKVQSSIIVAFGGKWNDECEKYFDLAVQSYFKIINKYSKALPQSQPTEEHKVLTPKVEPKSEIEKSPAIPKEPKDFVPNSQGSLIWGAKHYFNKNSQDIAFVLNKTVPSTPEELKESWQKLCQTWGKI